MFSSRLPGRLAENAISRTLASVRRSGTVVLDLTETNPTAVGLAYPENLLAPLADPRGTRYRPHPLGLDEARDAVVRFYQERARAIDRRQIVLTSSTSEAYALLFKLLCDAGDRVLVPQPSYPLFDLLTALEGVSADPYRLGMSAGWAVDRDSVGRALTRRSRAVLVVSPNNPTGSTLRSNDREWIVSVAEEHDLAIIADEVFADYPLTRRHDSSSLFGEDRVLTFALGGLSKSAGLPQVKLAWIAASGPERQLEEALARLEVIADTYLSVSTPVQLAAARLIEAGREIRRSVAARTRENLHWLLSRVAMHASLTLFEPEAGWAAVLRVPAIGTEEQIVLRLIEDAHVLVHPGYFFDFADEAFLVVSLLPEPAVFSEGVSRLIGHVTQGRR